MTLLKQKWEFGIIHTVEISEYETDWEIYLYLYEIEAITQLFDNQTFRVIGEIDRMIPLLQITGKPDVFALSEMESYSLFKVASTMNQLINFLSDAEKVWQNKPDSTILEATNDNLTRAHFLLNKFSQNNPGVNPDFWEGQCFSGLNMRFPLE